MIELADSAPLLGERRDEPPRLRPARGSRGLFGPAGSLLLHVLVLWAVLIGWHRSPPLDVKPIAVDLVILPPPPPPKIKPSAPAPLPRASESFGNPAAKAHQQATTPAETPAPQPAETAPATETAAMPPPPRAKPAAPSTKPPPAPARRAPAKQAAARPLDLPGKYPGPAATRDEYLAYCAALTRQHLDLLPRSFVGNRHGETVLEIGVLDDGTISLIRVSQSSGYPDIDRRIEQIVAAVKRFPPLPQWFQGPEIILRFRLGFPGALPD